MGNEALLPPGLAYLADNVVSRQNLLGAPRGTGAKWAKDMDIPKRGETVFFAGCGYQYAGELESMMGIVRKMDKSAVGSEVAMKLAGLQKKVGIDAGSILRKFARGEDSEAQPLKDAVAVLKKLGVDFGYLAEDEPCCGGILHYMGKKQDFARHSERIYGSLKSLGVKRIIGIVPSCTYTLRSLVSQNVSGYDIEVKHFTQVVAERMASRQWRFPKEAKVAYHDPCQLSRYLGIIEEPRQILKSIKGLTLVEPQWTSGEWSTCCGGGGGFEAVFPELSEILAVNRAQELVQAGAEIIVTSCPGCIMQLKTGLKGMKAENVEVMDIAQVVAQGMVG